MESSHFDAIVKHFRILCDRRQGLRVLLADLAAGVLGLADLHLALEADGRSRKKKKRRKKRRRDDDFVGPPVPCREITESCNPEARDGEVGMCCTTCCQTCLEHTKPECAVAFPDFRCCQGEPGASCATSCDCCGALLCGDTPCGGKACCRPEGADCSNDCDCCGPDAKCVDGTCGCAFNGESCSSNEECCGFPDLVCTRNSCDQQGVCCSEFGVICDPQNGDCDCCFPLKCQDDQTCRCIFNSQDTPCEFDRDCCYDNLCYDHGCCLPPGARCVQGEKCCAGHVCRLEAGGIVGECVAPACPEPGQRQRRRDGDRVAAEGVVAAPCPADDPVLCCQEGETCCTSGSSPKCCPAGTTCTTEGCIPPCPQDTDACDFGAEVTCGQGPLFAGCKCYRVGEFSFCARPTRCIACQDDPDCRGQGGHPAALCIPCPLCLPPDPPTMCVVPCVV